MRGQKGSRDVHELSWMEGRRRRKREERGVVIFRRRRREERGKRSGDL